MEIELRELRTSDETAFYDSLKPVWEENFIFAHYYEDTCEQDYNRYLKYLDHVKEVANVEQGRVPGTLLFAFNCEGIIVGRSSIRHDLNPHLLREGGHIGYGVLPAYRKLGIATEIFKKSLEYCKEHLTDLKKVLVTCDENNLGSQKTILKNGGVLENQVIISQEAPRKNRYWISL